MTDEVRYPALRADVLDALEALADRDYQARVWRDGEFPGTGAYESFDMAVHALYDDARLDRGAAVAIGAVLRDTVEADALDEVIAAIDAVFAELGTTDVDERAVLEAAAWPGVVEAARVALSGLRREVPAGHGMPIGTQLRPGAAVSCSTAEIEYLAGLFGGRVPGLATGATPDPDVRGELERRGVLDGAGAVADDDARRALRCALTGDALTLAACDGERTCTVTFFATEGAVVRHETDEADRHVLELVDRDTARAHLDEIVRAVAGAPANGAPACRVSLEQLAEVARLVAGGEPDRALAVLPEAAEYVAALADVRLVVTVAAQARRGDELHGTAVDIVQSPAHGLWLLDGDDNDDGGVLLRRISAPDLATRLEAMLDDVIAAASSA